MPAIFVIDRSTNTPSPLVQRLRRAGYHTLSLSDCRTTLETLQCVRPELVIVDVAAMGVESAAGLLRMLGRDCGGEGPAAVPVLVVGATAADQRALESVSDRGEILPAALSAPEDVLSHVRRYMGPERPLTTSTSTSGTKTLPDVRSPRVAKAP
jgi:hypothetical protein